MTSRENKPTMWPSVVLCGLLLAAVLADQIEFSANPSTVQFSVTPSLALKCSLKESSAPPPSTPTTSTAPTTGGTGLVGRAIPDVKNDDVTDNKSLRDDSSNVDKDLTQLPENTQSANTETDDVKDSKTASQNEAATAENTSSGKELRSSGSQTEAVAHVSSITISRDGEEVASVTSFTAPHVEAQADRGNVKVDGDVSGAGGELGFLSLQWSFPTTQETGAYTCTVRAITAAGHFMDFTQTVLVKTSEVSLDDMVREVHSLKTLVAEQSANLVNITSDYQKAMSTINTMQSTISSQENTISAMKANSATQTGSIINQTNTINTMQNTIISQQKMINTLKANSVTQNDSIAAIESRADIQQLSLYDFNTRLNDVKTKTDQLTSTTDHLQTSVNDALHVEHGVLYCGHNHDWKSESVQLFPDSPNSPTLPVSKTMSQTFSKMYSRPPVVFLATAERHTDTSHNVHFGTSLKNVTTKGFELMCASNAYSAYYVAYLHIRWMSVSV